MKYRLLTDEQRAQMVRAAALRLEAQRFEAELNALVADEGEDVAMTEHETAGVQLARLDRQLQRLHDAYGGWLT